MDINFGQIDIQKRWKKENDCDFCSGDVIISIQENGHISYDLFITDTDDKRKFLHDLQEGSTIEYTNFKDFFEKYAEIIDVIPYNKLIISKK
jgi:hypothetical protein